jgi:hypothetical protein
MIRPRLTIRRSLALVAILALLLGGYVAVERAGRVEVGLLPNEQLVLLTPAMGDVPDRHNAGMVRERFHFYALSIGRGYYELRIDGAGWHFDRREVHPGR